MAPTIDTYIVSKLNNMRVHGVMCDLELVAEDGTCVLVHSAMWIAAFEDPTCLREMGKEYTLSSNQLDIYGVKGYVLKKVVEFIYGNMVKPTDELKNALDKFGMKNWKTLLSDSVISKSLKCKEKPEEFFNKPPKEDSESPTSNTKTQTHSKVRICADRDNATNTTCVTVKVENEADSMESEYTHVQTTPVLEPIKDSEPKNRKRKSSMFEELEDQFSKGEQISELDLSKVKCEPISPVEFYNFFSDSVATSLPVGGECKVPPASTSFNTTNTSKNHLNMSQDYTLVSQPKPGNQTGYNTSSVLSNSGNLFLANSNPVSLDFQTQRKGWNNPLIAPRKAPVPQMTFPKKFKTLLPKAPVANDVSISGKPTSLTTMPSTAIMPSVAMEMSKTTKGTGSAQETTSNCDGIVKLEPSPSDNVSNDISGMRADYSAGKNDTCGRNVSLQQNKHGQPLGPEPVKLFMNTSNPLGSIHLRSPSQVCPSSNNAVTKIALTRPTSAEILPTRTTNAFATTVQSSVGISNIPSKATNSIPNSSQMVRNSWSSFTLPTGVLPNVQLMGNQTPTGVLPNVQLMGNQTQTGVLPNVQLMGNQTPTGVLPNVQLTGNQTQTGGLPNVQLMGNQTQTGVLPNVQLMGANQTQNVNMGNTGSRFLQPVTFTSPPAVGAMSLPNAMMPGQMINNFGSQVLQTVPTGSVQVPRTTYIPHCPSPSPINNPSGQNATGIRLGQLIFVNGTSNPQYKFVVPKQSGLASSSSVLQNNTMSYTTTGLQNAMGTALSNAGVLGLQNTMGTTLQNKATGFLPGILPMPVQQGGTTLSSAQVGTTIPSSQVSAVFSQSSVTTIPSSPVGSTLSASQVCATTSATTIVHMSSPSAAISQHVSKPQEIKTIIQKTSVPNIVPNILAKSLSSSFTDTPGNASSKGCEKNVARDDEMVQGKQHDKPSVVINLDDDDEDDDVPREITIAKNTIRNMRCLQEGDIVKTTPQGLKKIVPIARLPSSRKLNTKGKRKKIMMTGRCVRPGAASGNSDNTSPKEWGVCPGAASANSDHSPKEDASHRNKMLDNSSCIVSNDFIQNHLGLIRKRGRGRPPKYHQSNVLTSPEKMREWFEAAKNPATPNRSSQTSNNGGGNLAATGDNSAILNKFRAIAPKSNINTPP